MKEIYDVDIGNMFYEHRKYRPEILIQDSKLLYEIKIQSFMKRLNGLEEEFGLSVVADYTIDYDNMTESQLLLYDNKYGRVGEIYEVDEDENKEYLKELK